MCSPAHKLALQSSPAGRAFPSKAHRVHASSWQCPAAAIASLACCNIDKTLSNHVNGQPNRQVIFTKPHSAMHTACRVLSRILVAQRITRPQMVCQALVLLLHLAICALLIRTLHLGPASAAWSIAIANFNSCALLAAYVAWAGLQHQVWGRPSGAAFKVTQCQ